MAYTTLDLIKAELRITELSSSTIPTSSEVTNWIEEADSIIDVIAGETFSSVLETSEFYDYDGSGTFMLENIPVIEVTELKYNKSNSLSQEDNWVNLEEGSSKNFILYKQEGEIVFFLGSTALTKLKPISGLRKFCVTYSHGHESVPLEIQRLSTLMVTKQVISTLLNSQSNTEGGEVKVGPITVKDPTDFSVSYLKNINLEIEDLKNQIGQGFKTFRSRRVY